MVFAATLTSSSSILAAIGIHGEEEEEKRDEILRVEYTVDPAFPAARAEERDREIESANYVSRRGDNRPGPAKYESSIESNALSRVSARSAVPADSAPLNRISELASRVGRSKNRMQTEYTHLCSLELNFPKDTARLRVKQDGSSCRYAIFVSCNRRTYMRRLQNDQRLMDKGSFDGLTERALTFKNYESRVAGFRSNKIPMKNKE